MYIMYMLIKINMQPSSQVFPKVFVTVIVYNELSQKKRNTLRFDYYRYA